MGIENTKKILPYIVSYNNWKTFLELKYIFLFVARICLLSHYNAKEMYDLTIQNYKFQVQPMITHINTLPSHLFFTCVFSSVFWCFTPDCVLCFYLHYWFICDMRYIYLNYYVNMCFVGPETAWSPPYILILWHRPDHNRDKLININQPEGLNPTAKTFFMNLVNDGKNQPKKTQGVTQDLT